MKWSQGGVVFSGSDAQGKPLPEPHPSGVLLKDSLTKEQLFEELKISHKMLSLMAVQLGHGSQVNVAGHTETKLNMRHVILDLSKTQNSTLVDFLKKSRISVPSLFGPLLEFP